MLPGLLHEQRAAARARLAPEVFAYVAQGSGSQLTRRAARSAWDAHRLLPRVMQDVTSVSTAVDVLGERWSLPVGVAPMTMQRAAHPDGEVAMARAVAWADSTLVLSSNTGSTFSDVAATGVRWWLQLYATQHRAIGLDLARRAVQAGAGALVLTVDTPVVARKPDESVWDVVRPGWLGVELPGGGTTSRDGDGRGDQHAGRRKAADLGWADVAALQELGVPVVLKGVLHPRDAVTAVAHGVDALWVSNHGGRQLDQVVSTADALPSVVAAAREAATARGSTTTVLVDGGLRTPSHVLAAMALGADAAFLGRPALWALAADEHPDAPGVRRLLAASRDGVDEALRLLGVTSPAQVVGEHCR